jgi:hypothetical protein
MGPIGSAVSGVMKRATHDAAFRRELQAKPKEVLERELGRKLSKEELNTALVELRKHGIIDAANS